MKRPNGSGGVRKLSGRRRHPWQAVVSAGHEIRNNEIKVKQVSLGCYATRKEALEALGEWQTNHQRVDLRSMTVSDIWSKITPTLKESTIKNLEPIYNRYESLHNTRIVNIKTYTIEDIPIPRLSQGTYDNIRAFWHKIFQYALENDIVNKDYSQFLKFDDPIPPKKKEVFSPEEIKTCMEVPLYKDLLYTGMRIGELLNMKSDQVYEENGVLCFHVTKSKTEAGKRIIPVHKDLKIDLSGEYIIEPHKNYNVTKWEFNKFVKNAKMSYHTLHDFRRTFASYAKSCGCDDFYTKCLMGHTHNDITHDVYTEAFVDDLKQEMDKITY